MKIVLIVAVSEDGFIADSNCESPEVWTSSEDKKLFKSFIKQFPLQIMGSTTYRVHRPSADPAIQRIILTNRPEAYSSVSVPGQLDFMKSRPEQLVSALKKQYDSCLLLGGNSIYSDFLSENLVDEIFITREPTLLHSGVPFLNNEAKKKLAHFTLASSKRLNSQGTQLEHYVLKK